ncbi:MAG: T9SS type A sorting domain-containing protein [Mucilaginibacter polytrichastri]|nr:T9SS type A sorting domain-containing protein [Mucilaginibacter polytrichastri]
MKATLTTKTTGVTITQGTYTYGTVAANGGTGINTSNPFGFKLGSAVTCGTTIEFYLKVTYTGGKSAFRTFEFTTNVGAQPYNNIVANLGTPTAGSGYTVTTGQQIGRLSRGTDASVCGTQLANPGVLASAGNDPRLFDAYTFTNTSSVSQCVTTTMTADSGINMYTAAFNDSGFVPSSPSTHFLGDPGQSATTQTYAFTVASGKSFTVVVNEVNSGTLAGTPYKLSVSLSNCAASAARTDMILTASADQNKQVPVEWKVSNEADASQYDVERSADGVRFVPVTSVAATSSVADDKMYNSADVLPAEGNNFYRVKATDKSGNVVYSNVVMVNITNASGIAVTPNPASAVVTVYSKNTMKQIQLLGANGQLLKTVTPNATVQQLPIANLAAGQYMLRIQTANGVVNEKFIKQ